MNFKEAILSKAKRIKIKNADNWWIRNDSGQYKWEFDDSFVVVCDRLFGYNYEIQEETVTITKRIFWEAVENSDWDSLDKEVGHYSTIDLQTLAKNLGLE